MGTQLATVGGDTHAAMTPVTLVPDQWLGERLGRAVWRLETQPDPTSRRAVGLHEALAALTPPALVWARVPVDDVDLAHALEGHGFRLVDTTLTLERDPFPPADAVAEVRPARPDDEAEVVALARRGFSCSRFHLDPGLQRTEADEIKAAWVGSYFKGCRGDAMLVAESGGRINGFLIALVAPDGAMVIDLVAVDEAARGRGLAGSLTRAAQKCFPESTRLRTGTQAANSAALGAYQKLGFAVVAAASVFHLHLHE